MSVLIMVEAITFRSFPQPNVRDYLYQLTPNVDISKVIFKDPCS
jgi:hypothetical protein